MDAHSGHEPGNRPERARVADGETRRDVLRTAGAAVTAATVLPVAASLPAAAAPERRQGDSFDRLTEGAKQVLVLAQEEAQRFNHNYIGTEHLLAGLVGADRGTAAQVLAGLGVGLDQVRAAIEYIIGRGDRMVAGDISLTPRAKRVLEQAVVEARRLDHSYIGTEHLLLGLVREGRGIAAGVLEHLLTSREAPTLGSTPSKPFAEPTPATLERVQAAVLEHLGPQ